MRYVSTKLLVICAAFAGVEAYGNSNPWKGPSRSLTGVRESEGWVSSILRIAERCTPASTARREPRCQLVDVDRTRKAVVLLSIGPPPEP